MTEPLLVEVSTPLPAAPLEIGITESLLVEVAPLAEPLEITVPGQTLLVEIVAPPQFIEIEVGVPGPPGPPGSPAGGSLPYAKRADEVSTALVYKGEAEPGSAEADPVWRISRFTFTDAWAEEWANGTAAFENAWTDHLTLDYA